jgi:hypothetical protein
VAVNSRRACLRPRRTRESIDLFLREEDARHALQDILSDEPEWAGMFYIKPVELDERAVSAN